MFLEALQGQGLKGTARDLRTPIGYYLIAQARVIVCFLYMGRPCVGSVKAHAYLYMCNPGHRSGWRVLPLACGQASCCLILV
jgi:hypothetical protein